MYKLVPPFLFCLMFFIQSFVATAQKQFPGSITKSSGEKMSGEIILNKVGLTLSSISFISDGNIQNLGIGEIRDFSIKRADNFEEFYNQKSIQILSRDTLEPRLVKKNVFLKLILKGPISLFEYGDLDRFVYFIQPESGELVELENYPIQVQKDEYGKSFYTVKYRSQLKINTNDCPVNIDEAKVRYNWEKISTYLKQYAKCKNAPLEYLYRPVKKTVNFYAVLGGGIQKSYRWGTSELEGKSTHRHPLFSAGFQVDLHFNKKLSFSPQILFENQQFNDSLIYDVSTSNFIKIKTEYENFSISAYSQFKYHHWLNKKSKLTFAWGPALGIAPFSSYKINRQEVFLGNQKTNNYSYKERMARISALAGVGFHHNRFGVELGFRTGINSHPSYFVNQYWNSFNISALFQLNKTRGSK